MRRIIRGKAGAASALDASQDKYQFYDVRGYILVRMAKLARCQQASIRSLASARPVWFTAADPRVRQV